MVCLTFCVSCSERTRKDETQLPSQGQVNQVLVVIDDDLWLSNVGDTIRNYLAAAIEGITPVEPKFDIDQQSPRIFESTAKSSKHILYVSTSEKRTKFELLINEYAQPQHFFVVEGKDNKSLIDNFLKHKDSIISRFHHQEISEMQDRFKESVLRDADFLQHKYKIKLDLPASYKRVLTDDSFVWYKKEIASGTSNILIYCLPYERIKSTTDKRELTREINFLRDSVVEKYVHSSESNTFMNLIVDAEPLSRTIELNGVGILEVTGIWDMENSFMGGPYLSYIAKVEDKKYYLILEGFTYNPSMSKRNVLLELEAIMRTLRINP